MLSIFSEINNLYLNFHVCAPDFQRRPCHVANEVVVEEDDMDTYSAPSRLRREDTEFNSNPQLNKSKAMYHTKMGKLVEGSLREDNNDRILERPVQSPWGPPRINQSSSPHMDFDDNVKFYSFFQF